MNHLIKMRAVCQTPLATPVKLTVCHVSPPFFCVNWFYSYDYKAANQVHMKLHQRIYFKTYLDVGTSSHNLRSDKLYWCISKHLSRRTFCCPCRLSIVSKIFLFQVISVRCCSVPKIEVWGFVAAWNSLQLSNFFMTPKLKYLFPNFNWFAGIFTLNYFLLILAIYFFFILKFNE